VTQNEKELKNACEQGGELLDRQVAGLVPRLEAKQHLVGTQLLGQRPAIS